MSAHTSSSCRPPARSPPCPSGTVRGRACPARGRWPSRIPSLKWCFHFTCRSGVRKNDTPQGAHDAPAAGLQAQPAVHLLGGPAILLDEPADPPRQNRVVQPPGRPAGRPPRVGPALGGCGPVAAAPPVPGELAADGGLAPPDLPGDLPDPGTRGPHFRDAVALPCGKMCVAAHSPKPSTLTQTTDILGLRRMRRASHLRRCGDALRMLIRPVKRLSIGSTARWLCAAAKTARSL